MELQPAKQAGEDIRQIGSDIKEGQLVLGEGELVGAAEIGILATVGASKIEVQLSHAFLKIDSKIPLSLTQLSEH